MEVQNTKEFLEMVGKFAGLTEKQTQHLNRVSIEWSLGRIPEVSIGYILFKTFPEIEKEKPIASVTKRMGQAPSWKEERDASKAKVGQPAKAAEFGYCRNCGEKIEHERWGKFCKVECRNQYNVRKCWLRKDKDMEIDTMITWMDEKGKHKYFTEEEFTAALRTTGLFPEGARLVTPEGHLRVVVMQAGQMTYEERYPNTPLPTSLPSGLQSARPHPSDGERSKKEAGK